jgi:preprotein translocase subunit SecB
MQLSPLILKAYFVTSVSFKAHPPVASSQEDIMKLIAGGVSNLRTTVETAKAQDNFRAWKVVLRISLGPSDPAAYCPYLIEIELLGFFEADQSVPEDNVEDLMVCNAPALLYGAAREFLVLVTGRGPLPPYVLPSVNFVDQSKANRASSEERAGFIQK